MGERKLEAYGGKPRLSEGGEVAKIMLMTSMALLTIIASADGPVTGLQHRRVLLAPIWYMFFLC